jgi:hypothetical protein
MNGGISLMIAIIRRARRFSRSWNRVTECVVVVKWLRAEFPGLLNARRCATINGLDESVDLYGYFFCPRR